MAISTNSVIHFTERIDSLKDILRYNGFRLKYCLEEIYLKEAPLSIAIPMVSFCDIPLSEIKNHIDSYGSYGIGLTKSWAKQSGLNPVLYIENKSRLSKILTDQIVRLANRREEGITDKRDDDFILEWTGYISYFKNYEGRLVRGKSNTDSYRFYDEREWRFIALDEELNQPSFLAGDDYAKDKEKYNERIKECYVKFSHSDITYLIVDHEEEIPELLKVINDVYEDNATAKELKIMSTKILTKNQIWNDF